MKLITDRSKPGFALISVLLMTILLMIFAVGLLGMSSIELRKTGSTLAPERARANARLALIMALGKLQESLGPDQRVSGTARTASRGTEPAHPHWISAWKTTQDDGIPWIERDPNKGLVDRRRTFGWDATDTQIACLVSGKEGKLVGPGDDGGNVNDMITLVDQGSLGSSAPDGDIVRAPRVRIGNNGQSNGAYAWWIGDLGMQANVATRDRSATEPDRKHHSRMLAQDASWKAFGEMELSNESREKLASEAQLALVEKNLSNRHFHDVTVWSAGLPVNVKDGGWRSDLTAFMESNGSVPGLEQGDVNLPGLSDTDNIIRPSPSAATSAEDRYAEVSPKFGLLRTWAQRSREAPIEYYRAKTETGQMANRSTGGRNSKSVDFRNQTKSHLMPVLTEGSLYYNLSYYDAVKPPPGNPYAMRVHYYPRVTLWNPYNFELEIPESAIFLHINGSKSVEVTLQNGQKQSYRMFWGLGGSATGGSVRGSMFFKMASATLKPGESLVWSAADNMAYDEKNFSRNLLTPNQSPSPTRAIYQDSRADGYPLFQVLQSFPPRPGLANNLLPQIPIEWREIVPPKPSGNLQSAAYTQADDYFMSWKPINNGTFNEANFANMPMGRFISCAYQYGDEDELPVEWTALDPVPYVKSATTNPVVTLLPDRRTRDGFRLRWFQETESNILGSGSLAGTPHLEDSPLGNWNMRASWAFRNPFDNVTDVAPHFFGIYTRDLFDGEVGWTSMNPRASDGRFHGDPFDQPVRSQTPRILFDIPRTGTEVASLGAFQHVNFSEFIWHPTYAFGNSLVDPRVPSAHTEPDRSESINKDKGGWNQDSIGYSTDGRSNNNGETNRTHDDNWAWHARNFLQQAALNQSLVYDLSFELNHRLWDSYFISTGTLVQKQAFLKNPEQAPLPNGRMMLNPMAGEIQPEDLTDFHRSGSKILIDGAFNVNSTSVAAWEALLLSGLGHQIGADTVAFPRILNTPEGEWDGRQPGSAGAWGGQRVFDRGEIRRLAEEIVQEVQIRGPFLSLSDFVNRRLSDDATGKKGTLQAAIDRAGLNAAFTAEWPLNNSETLPDYVHNDHIIDPTRMDQTSKPETTAWGALGFLSQADLLQFIGPALAARSDTFRIRACGESFDSSGKVIARAFCEAIVQRSPQYIHPSDDPLENFETLQSINQKFGRRFEIISFRWLKPQEV